MEDHALEDYSWEPKHTTLVGIIGGIGPAAGVLLQKYIVEGENGDADDAHIPFLMYNNPKIPNNYRSWTGEGKLATPAMVYTAKALKRAGATHVCLACNTAHVYANEIQKQAHIPVISMIDITAEGVIAQLSRKHSHDFKKSTVKVGLLSTIGTAQSQIFHDSFMKVNRSAEVLVPDASGADKVQECIIRVKSGDFRSDIYDTFRTEAELLLKKGAQCIITGCTEIPLVFSETSTKDFPVPIVDPMKYLARHIIDVTNAGEME